MADAMRASVALASSTHEVAVTALGRNCHLPGALQSPMHLFTCTEPLQLPACGPYQAAVTDTILQARAPAVTRTTCTA